MKKNNSTSKNPSQNPPNVDSSKSSQYPGFDENMFPTNDANTPISTTRPFTKYRAVEMALCIAAIILGLLYLYTDLVTLALLLPAFSVGMAVITALRILDGREALAKNTTSTGKIGKAAAYFPAAFSGFLTIVVIIVTVTYFTGAAG